MPASFPRLRGLVAFLPLLTVACGSSAEFSVKYAEAVTAAPTTVSVLGVLQDGRLEPEAWATLGTALQPAFGGSCPVAYDAELVRSKPTLALAVDEYTRANGVTSELLDKLAPSATGESILVFTLRRERGRAATSSPEPAAPAQSPVGRGGRGFRGGHGAHPSNRRPGAGTDPVLDLSASLHSNRLHSPVLHLHMTYTGEDDAEGLRQFADRLKKELHASPCKGWNWAVPPDEASIRRLTNP